jgi:hypothetical protein
MSLPLQRSVGRRFGAVFFFGRTSARLFTGFAFGATFTAAFGFCVVSPALAFFARSATLNAVLAHSGNSSVSSKRRSGTRQ